MKALSEDVRCYYVSQAPDHYARQMKAGGFRTFWFRKRQQMTRLLVSRHSQGGRLLDLGCGNCLWNTSNVPVIGIDICSSMLRYNREHIKGFLPLKADVCEGLPFADHSLDGVVITEFLEHVPQYDVLIHEIWRVLRKGGCVICSVPMGGFPYAWKLLFEARCAYLGWKYNDLYYKNRCGHRVDFTPRSLRAAFSDFEVLEYQSLYYLTMFFVFRK